MQVQQLRLLGKDALVGVAEPGSELLEADVLLSHVLKVTRVEILAHPEFTVESEKVREFLQLLERRKTHEPIAYIVGEKEFFGFSFLVTPDVLIPRPETELLVELVLAELIPLCENEMEFTVIDVGTGSGAILLSLAKVISDRFIPRGRFVGVDISEDALRVAALNSARLGLTESVLLGPSNLLATFRACDQSQMKKFPRPIITVANLPYISPEEVIPKTVEEFEPYIALRSNSGGLSHIQSLIEQWREISLPDEHLFLEVGKGQSAKLVSATTSDVRVMTHRDLAGVERVVQLTKQKNA
jgi:release factor glutamine methyltransferase